MRIIAWPATDVGRVRSHNEDSHLVDDEIGLYLVADGMGGHAGGAHASQLCVDIVDKVVRRGLEQLGSVRPAHRNAAIAEMLCAAASEANRLSAASDASRPRRRRCGIDVRCGFIASSA